MFFNKRKRVIESLTENLKLEEEKAARYKELATMATSSLESFEDIIKQLQTEKEDLVAKNKELIDKNISLKKEVSRLNTAKKQLLESKEACQKVIKDNKIKYNRDSKGRFAKKD